jgi:hypothetical protein
VVAPRHRRRQVRHIVCLLSAVRVLLRRVTGLLRVIEAADRAEGKAPGTIISRRRIRSALISCSITVWHARRRGRRKREGRHVRAADVRAGTVGSVLDEGERVVVWVHNAEAKTHADQR